MSGRGPFAVGLLVAGAIGISYILFKRGSRKKKLKNRDAEVQCVNPVPEVPDFGLAAQYVRNHGEDDLSQTALLELYGWYKQVTNGDCPDNETTGFGSRHYMRKSWIAKRGVTRVDAARYYIAIVEQESKKVDWRGKANIERVIKDCDSNIWESSSDGGRRDDTASQKDQSLASRLSRPVVGVSDVSGSHTSWDNNSSSGIVCMLAAEGDLQGVSKAIKHCRSAVHFRDSDGLTPLHWACDRGMFQVAKFLLENEADVTATDNLKETPLHLCVTSGYLDVCKLLVDFGADASLLCNADGESCLDIAIAEGEEEIVSVLQEREAKREKAS